MFDFRPSIGKQVVVLCVFAERAAVTKRVDWTVVCLFDSGGMTESEPLLQGSGVVTGQAGTRTGIEKSIPGEDRFEPCHVTGRGTAHDGLDRVERWTYLPRQGDAYTDLFV